MAKCKKHPNYITAHKPKADCIVCWVSFLSKVKLLEDEVMAKIAEIADKPKVVHPHSSAE